ncbi:hypothetical protein RPO35_02640 [Staphylococcus hominis]|nr:hypothetical protein [Staphylococcus hominis]MDS3850807.1 hypothetical protein [Staphylococcus hominis]MDT4035666.1 hypothetical protein [Staphylococcus hominis]WRY66398.1 hypothetical protein P8632_03430 [Staphylococcus hominis]
MQIASAICVPLERLKHFSTLRSAFLYIGKTNGAIVIFNTVIDYLTC